MMISLHSCSQKEKKIETFHSGIGFVYNLDLCIASNKADEEHREFELSKLKPEEWIDFFFFKWSRLIEVTSTEIA